MCGPDQQSGLPPGTAAESGSGLVPPAVTVGPGDGSQADNGASREPGSVTEAVQIATRALGWLAAADVASVPVAVQADCLRQLERITSVHTAARASVLSAFDAAGGYEDDAARSPRTWLRWQTQVTSAAASSSVWWMRRLRSHPAVAAALAAGSVSASWARDICDWTDRLPEDARDDADQILLAAAAAAARLEDLARLAEEMRRRLADPDDDDGGFEDRYLRLQTTLGGAGRLDGDLTARCAEAVQAVLDALGKKAGPEDTRTQRQRNHDALEEACRRLIASGGLPDRAGQPTKIHLHLTLDELARLHQDAQPGNTPDHGSPHRALDDNAPAGSGSAGSGSAGTGSGGSPDGNSPDGSSAHGAGSHGSSPDGTGQPGAGTRPGHANDVRPDHEFFGPAATPGDTCDATIIPVVTGRIDHDLLDQLTAKLTSAAGNEDPDRSTVLDLIIANAIALLSGPGQIASLLRTGTLAGPAATISLPLDLGTSTETIPPHLRRAVILRDKHCAAPGCFQQPAGCHVHHTTPRSQGGPTRLTDLILLCPFHHLIVVHQWGWTITLNPDGTTTMRSPDGSKIYHSHSPPTATAA